MTQIIGLSGWARSGKDTIAEHLVANYGYTRVAFADPMREALVRLDPLITYANMRVRLSTVLRFATWDDLKADSEEVRGLLQRMGTEVGREMFGQNVWVDRAVEKIKTYEKVVISDCRFINELEAIKNLNGVIWRISRQGIEAPNNHISETQLDNFSFDLNISNNGTLENLYKLVDQEMLNV